MTDTIANKAQLLKTLRTCLEVIDERQCYSAGAYLCQCIDWVEKTMPEQDPRDMANPKLSALP